MRKVIALIMVVFIWLVLPVSVEAAPRLTDRRLQLRSSAPSETNVIYDFSFVINETDDLGSIKFEFCSNSPLFSEPCNAPSGFNALGVAVDSESGETGFTIHPSSTSNTIILSRVPAAPTPGAVSYGFDGVANPDYIGTFYSRISTYGSTDATGPRIEEGGVAVSTATQIDVSAEVPPYIIFCVAQSIVFQDCSTASGTQVGLGTFSDVSVSFGNAQMLAATNAEFGYSIVSHGTTLTSGTNTIDAMTTRAPSNPGQAQFGMNLAANTNPSAGINPTGPGTATGEPDYATTNEFKFLSGDPLVVTTGVNDRRTFTATYIVNIPSDQPAGVYTTTLTYICTALF